MNGHDRRAATFGAVEYFTVLHPCATTPDPSFIQFACGVIIFHHNPTPSRVYRRLTVRDDMVVEADAFPTYMGPFSYTGPFAQYRAKLPPPYVTRTREVGDEPSYGCQSYFGTIYWGEDQWACYRLDAGCTVLVHSGDDEMATTILTRLQGLREEYNLGVDNVRTIQKRLPGKSRGLHAVWWMTLLVVLWDSVDVWRSPPLLQQIGIMVDEFIGNSTAYITALRYDPQTFSTLHFPTDVDGDS
jgi:hypothetical protein